MSSLPELWDVVVAAISSSWRSKKLKCDEIWDVVLSQSIRIREIEDLPSSVLSVDKMGRSESKSPNKGRSISKNRGNVPKTKCNVLKLWTKMSHSDILYKNKEEAESQIKLWQWFYKFSIRHWGCSNPQHGESNWILDFGFMCIFSFVFK